MSSHHIVRENQEPALLVAAVGVLDSEQMGQLLEWSPTILADDQTVDFLLAEQIKVDIVFTNRAASYYQEQIKTLPLERGLLIDGLSYLAKSNYGSVNILCDTLPDDLCAHVNGLTAVVFCDDRRYVYVQHRYEKWKEAGSRIFVQENVLKSLSGLRKIARHVFETEQDGFFYLEFNTDRVVTVGEDL
ncbi:MAG TPA: hypothetical protein VK017_13770 [Sphingobacterium sp.]|jgi:thiamine pyrophosphokinase|nr:hypothetical protein [Sphingobacterium sp.]